MWSALSRTPNIILPSAHDRIGGIHLERPQGVRIWLLLQTTEWFT
jgi:hypothetical protein